MSKPKCMITVDVEALPMRAPDNHVDTLIYGRIGGEEWGIGRMMDIADKHGVKMTFFLDFAEAELYGDQIIEVGKYIASRGHDLQVHCHYDLLWDAVRSRFPKVDNGDYYSYYTWYEDEEISEFCIDYCLEQYRKCGVDKPIVFRGGEYRLGAALIKKLKEKGVAADATYNFIRPIKKPDNKQFMYENELLELPVSCLPKTKEFDQMLLNFNFKSLYPASTDEYDRCLKGYEQFFRSFYGYYGEDAIATMMMHSWSFNNNKVRFQSTGYIDRPDPCAIEFFDKILETFCPHIDFISAAQAVELLKGQDLKTVDFDSAFSVYGGQTLENLRRVESFIRKKAGNRQIVIWGRGWLESMIMRVLNLDKLLNVSFYISRDADFKRTHRGRPVMTFEEAQISPEKYYVLVMAISAYSEIRDSLREEGFREFEDYYDIEVFAPYKEDDIPVKKAPCPICGGNEFELYNGNRPRRCVKCGSVERQRTIPKLFAENIGMECLSGKILHVSPGRSERMFFKQANAQNITTIDIRPQVKADITADICNMPQVASDSFDIVFANCVLNHVYDDEAALNEIHRVLRDKGLFVVWVMGSGEKKTTVDKDPTAWYGAETMETYRVGTYRHYGETDFTTQLKRHFAKVRSYEKYDAVTETSCLWYVCEK